MKPRERSILLVDGQSFYASIEKSAHPEYLTKPVAVGNPERRSGIILAACPIAKARGVSTTMRASEALALCPELVIIKPRMQRYITISLLITRIFETFTDLVEPYSIDEQFLDVTGSMGMYGSAEEIARQIQHKVMLSTGVWSRVGIGPTKILAKMETDNFAKQMSEGIFRLDQSNIEQRLWPLPIHKMFMVASRMTNRFVGRGIHTIGDIATMELPDFKRIMSKIMGKQSDIQAEYYWQTARGIDPSPVVSSIYGKPKSIGDGKTLKASLYSQKEDIEVVLLELCIEVCSRARRLGYQGRVVTLAVGETDGDRRYTFNRQVTLCYFTSITHELITVVSRLFNENWRGFAVSHIAISLTQLTGDDAQQLDLFNDRAKAYELEKAADHIKDRFGETAIMRASSLLDVGVARERAGQIGGHFK